MSRAFTSVLVGVTPPVLEIWLPGAVMEKFNRSEPAQKIRASRD